MAAAACRPVIDATYPQEPGSAGPGSCLREG